MDTKVGNPTALTIEQVVRIRQELDRTNLHDLADEFNCSKITIRNAALGKTPYDKVIDPLPLSGIPKQQYRRKKETELLMQNVKIYREQLQNSDTFREKEATRFNLTSDNGLNAITAKEFGISESYVSRICNGHYDK